MVALAGAGFMSIPGGLMIQKLCLFAIFLITLVLYNGKLKVPCHLKVYFFLLLALSLYSFVSGFVYYRSLLSALLVSQKFLVVLICFLICGYLHYNISNRSSFQTTKNLLIVIILSQFFFVILKLLVLGGVNEGFLIGSMHHNAGQLGFLFPAILIPITVLIYSRDNRRWLMLILLVMLYLFAVINEKRAFFYLGLPILLISFYCVFKGAVSLKNGTMLFLALTSAFFLLMYTRKFIGSLSGTEGDVITPSGFSFLFWYAYEYLTMGYGGALQGSEDLAAVDRNVQVGRFIVWAWGLEFFQKMELFDQIFGLGLGSLTPSSYLNSPDVMFQVLGFRGAMSGALHTLIEGGVIFFVLNNLLIILPLVRLLKSKMYYHRLNAQVSFENKLCSVLLVVWTVFVFDFYLYSMSLFATIPLPIIYVAFLFAMPVASRYHKREYAN